MVLAIVAVIAISVFVLVSNTQVSEDQEGIKKFASYEELKNFVEASSSSYGYYGSMVLSQSSRTNAVAISGTDAMGEAAMAVPSAAGSEDYSKTNIQVEGVDEADIVKNDGKYIYAVSGKKVIIIDVYPAESASIVGEIELNGSPNEIFVNGDKLVVFGQENYYSRQTVSMPEIGIVPRPYTQGTFLNVYDITDRSNPVITRNISIDGYYYDSRMIGDYVYVIVNENVYYSSPQPIPMPAIREGGTEKMVAATDIYYFDTSDSSYIFTNVVSINTQNDAEDYNLKTYLMGYSENMYVSADNIYVVYTKRLTEYDFIDRLLDEAILPSVPLDIQMKINEIRNSDKEEYEKMNEIGDVLEEYMASLGPEEAANFMKVVQEKYIIVQEEIAKEMEKTLIHKINIQNGAIDYDTSGQVSGIVLNQFSMDQYENTFRIATTTGNWRAQSSNHLYVLNDNLQIIGSVEDLAKGERIYSVRFLGNKAYMVTFRQIDPLFVIDLSNPTSPAVLGYLKVPGVSDYLHPYDETHIIGVGRDATENGRITGMKLSLFDVSDFSNPKEISKYIIGESGTYSEALNDHKAFLFSKEKNLLVIPVREYEKNYKASYQGAYVFYVDLTEGFVLKGRITHNNLTAMQEDRWYYDWNSEVRRSLYIDDVLYTVSNKMIKMNDLYNLDEINKVNITAENYDDYYYKVTGMAVEEVVDAPA